MTTGGGGADWGRMAHPSPLPRYAGEKQAVASPTPAVICQVRGAPNISCAGCTHATALVALPRR
jgi:hypothetical protein